MLVSPFFGRTAELRVLDDRLRAAAGGEGGVVLISGEAGIGKTRLVRQFLDTLLLPAPLVAEGRWHESEEMPAFVGFRESLWGFVERDDVRAALDVGNPYVRALADLGSEFTALAGDADAPSDVSDDPYRLWNGVVSLLRAASCVAPTVLALDDLQWADTGSIELLGFLGRQIATMPLLMICAYRSDEVRADHPLLAAEARLRHAGSVSVLRLDPLSLDNVCGLVASAVGPDVDPAFIQRLYDLTGGNPLFVEEMLRHLRAQTASAGPAPSMSALLDGELPQGIRDVMQRRVGALSEECQYVLQLAACVGREFDSTLLAGISGLPERDVLDLLSEAVAAAAITERVPGQFSFAHPLMSEVTYRSIPSPYKTAMHQRVAVVLEDAFGPAAPRHARRIAHHLVASGQLADPASTVTYCTEAARQARALFAFDEARRFLRAALAAMERLGASLPRLRAHLLLQLGYVETAAGQPDEALRYYRDALATFDALDDSEGRTDAYRWMTTTLVRYGRWPEALAMTREGLARAQPGRTSAYVGLVGNHALAAMLNGVLDEAADYAGRLLELSFDDETIAVAHHVLAGQHSWGLLDHAEALDHFSESRRRFLRVGRDATASQVALDQAFAAYFLGDVPLAREVAAESKRMAETGGRRSVLADLYAFDVMASAHRADWPAARRALDGWRALQRELGGATVYGQIAQRALALERYWKRGPADAIELLPDTFPLLRAPLATLLTATSGGLNGAALAEDHRRQKDILPRDGRGFVWLAHALPLVAACTELGHRDDLAAWLPALERYRGCLFDWFVVDIELGRACAALERWDDADAHFLRARETCRAAGLDGFLGHAFLHHGLMYWDRRARTDRRKGSALIERARDAFAAADLEYFADRADALLTAPRRGRPSAAGPAGLTRRELDVLALLADGGSNRGIARRLVLSERTVERHLDGIYRKLGASGRGAAIAWYFQNLQSVD